jgi:hypothetical protein
VLRRHNKKATERDELRPVFLFSGKRKNTTLPEEKGKRKKWAEARREEEEDFNLSPWFI